MCDHLNITNEKYGYTCVDCSTYFNNSFYHEFTSNYNGPIIAKSSSSIADILKKEFGIHDINTIRITEKIFNLTSENKMVKGNNKRSILCASLYYAYYFLNEPKDFEEMLKKFNINHIQGSKGLKKCQIVFQEYGVINDKELKLFKDQIHSFTSSHKEKLQDLLLRYKIPLKNYNEIEKIIIVGHHKKNKILTDKINALWISCIYFWLSKINPLIDLEEFVSMSNDYITLSQLKSDLTYLNKLIFLVK